MTPTLINWIRVTDSLPDMDRTVLCAIPSSADDPVASGYYTTCVETGDPCWAYDDGRLIVEEVTHWANMPPPPALHDVDKGK